MTTFSGSTYTALLDAGWVDSSTLDAAADELGIKKRRLDEWRSWGLIPRPRRAGNEGKRPRWLYPPHTTEQLRRAAYYKPTSRTADAAKFALWVDGFPYSSHDVRAAIASVVRDWEQAPVKELLRHAPEGVDEARLREDEAVLRQAVDGLAHGYARRRSATLPLPRDVRLTLPERERAMRYLICSMLGLQRDEDDAVLAERVLGVSRGHSAEKRGITWPAESTVPNVSPTELCGAVERADDLALEMVRNALQTMLILFPSLTSFVQPMSPLRPFTASATRLFEDAPYVLRALYAAFVLTSIEKHRATHELTSEIVGALAPENVRKEIQELRIRSERTNESPPRPRERPGGTTHGG